MSNKYYAVVKGKIPGIYDNWTETNAQVKGFPGNLYKGFKNRSDAEFFLQESTIKKCSENINNSIIYTDGSCKEKNCGFGIVILPKDGKKYTYYGRVPQSAFDLNSNDKNQYNDVAELYAIYASLSLIDGDVTLYTDCNYAVNTFTSYINDWIKTGKLSTKENQQLITAIYNQMQTRNVEIHHVYSHKGIKYNEECDKLAKLGTLMTTDDLIFSAHDI